MKIILVGNQSQQIAISVPEYVSLDEVNTHFNDLWNEVFGTSWIRLTTTGDATTMQLLNVENRLDYTLIMYNSNKMGYELYIAFSEDIKKFPLVYELSTTIETLTGDEVINVTY